MEDRNLINKSDSMSTFPFRRFDSLMETLHQQMDSLFSTGSFDMSIFDEIQPRGNFPKMNVKETENSYIVEAAIAGFAKEDVELELKENILYLKGEYKGAKESTNEKILKKEIAMRSFRRAIRFPHKINTEDINCTYDKGIITCTIGKVEPNGPKTTKIKIN